MPRTRERNEQMREERKAQIRAAALALFASKGLFATKISDIAESVGMSQGLIYHYFGSKEEIFAELIGDALDKMNAAVLMLRRMQAPPGEKIRAAIKELIRTIETSEPFTQTCRLIEQAANSTAIPLDARALIDEKRDTPYREIAEIMAEGQRDGSIVAGDPNELAVVLWTSINGLAIYKATREGDVTMPSPEILINLFLTKRKEDAP